MVSSNVPVSVVVPIYNAEEYLPECIDSILAQTLENLELILVDDGSTDRSGKICDEYREKDPSVCVIHRENGGAAAARLTGTRAAKGEYVGFVDSDDVVSPYLYESLFSAAVRLNLDCSKIETGDLLSAKRPARTAAPEEFTVFTGNEWKRRYVRAYISGLNETISMCDKIVRRELLLSGNGEENVGSILEDYTINMNMALRYSRYGELNRVYYFVRYRRGSLSRRWSDSDFSVLLQVQRRKEEIIGQIGCTREERTQAHRWFADYAVSLITKLYEYPGAKSRRKKALEILKNAQVVESCRCLIDSKPAGRRIWYKMIGHKTPRLALGAILIRYGVKKIYDKIKYTHRKAPSGMERNQ